MTLWHDRHNWVDVTFLVLAIVALCCLFFVLSVWAHNRINTNYPPSCCEANAKAITDLSDRLDAVEATRDERETFLARVCEVITKQLTQDRVANAGLIRSLQDELVDVRKQIQRMQRTSCPGGVCR